MTSRDDQYAEQVRKAAEILDYSQSKEGARQYGSVSQINWLSSRALPDLTADFKSHADRRVGARLVNSIEMMISEAGRVSAPMDDETLHAIARDADNVMQNPPSDLSLLQDTVKASVILNAAKFYGGLKH